MNRSNVRLLSSRRFCSLNFSPQEKPEDVSHKMFLILPEVDVDFFFSGAGFSAKQGCSFE